MNSVGLNQTLQQSAAAILVFLDFNVQRAAAAAELGRSAAEGFRCGCR
jgi:hypothetical protein